MQEDRDQFFRVEEGEGEVVIDGVTGKIAPDSAMIVPAGARHSVKNTGAKVLLLCILYAPPEPRGGAPGARLSLGPEPARSGAATGPDRDTD